MTDWPGDITAYKRADGSLRLEVRPGPLRVTKLLVASADPRWLSKDKDMLVFHGIEDDGSLRSYAYSIRGSDDSGPEGGWLLCEPLVELGS